VVCYCTCWVEVRWCAGGGGSCGEALRTRTSGGGGGLAVGRVGSGHFWLWSCFGRWFSSEMGGLDVRNGAGCCFGRYEELNLGFWLRKFQRFKPV
jgi:hypothetical protein